MRNIEVGTAGDFCENCLHFELEEIRIGAWFLPDRIRYRCKHYQSCSKAIELFAKSKGIKIEEEPQEDDWMEDQAL